MSRRVMLCALVLAGCHADRVLQAPGAGQLCVSWTDTVWAPDSLGALVRVPELRRRCSR